MWKKEKERDNNILVFGNDLIANEQNQYEGAMLGTIFQIGFFMNDGKIWGTLPWGPEGFVNGDYMYDSQYLYYMLNQTYNVYAKDW